MRRALIYEKLFNGFLQEIVEAIDEYSAGTILQNSLIQKLDDSVINLKFVSRKTQDKINDAG